MGKRPITSSKTIITSSDIQVKYEHLYKFLMDFLWEFRVVQALANLEIAIFKRFPDKDEMSRCLRLLNQEIRSTYNELSRDDEPEFKEAYEELEEAIEDYEDPGCELYSVEEVVDDPEDIEAAEIMERPGEKHKFKFGDIEKISKEERELRDEAARTLSNPFEEGEE